MIIRSGLIRNRDGVDFAAFSEHWRHVHGPLALRVEAMRAYRRNHILTRLPAPQGDGLHRVDGISNSGLTTSSRCASQWSPPNSVHASRTFVGFSPT